MMSKKLTIAKDMICTKLKSQNLNLIKSRNKEIEWENGDLNPQLLSFGH